MIRIIRKALCWYLYMDWQALISGQPTLAHVPESLRQRAEPWDLEAGEQLFRIGGSIHAVFTVINGEVRLTRRDRNGTEVVLQRSRGGFFAEASLNSKAYHCDAVAAEKSTLLRFPLQAFRLALAEDAGFRDAWMTHLAREVRKLRAQCERLSLHSAAERVLHYLESEGSDGSVALTQTRKAWAAELGLSHEALYRTLKKLQEDAVIQIDGNEVTVRDRFRPNC
ncbi:MAG: putative transcriptional regulator, Crp/Fnr family [Rhodocyclaceae bacterium]|nr:putative transcriptional regulator, Crp/Fnr family [Rhodocyclaceae bacterium]